jgi:hypothetical protein
MALELDEQRRDMATHVGPDLKLQPCEFMAMPVEADRGGLVAARPAPSNGFRQ